MQNKSNIEKLNNYLFKEICSLLNKTVNELNLLIYNNKLPLKNFRYNRSLKL